MIADALDLRHRLPLLWAALEAGTVRAWQARHVAKRTRATGLTLAQAREVDRTTTPYLATLPWGRFVDLLEARIVAVDPAAAEARREAAELDRFVVTGQSTEHGLKTLIAKATAGEVIYLVAMVDRLAQILELEGDTSPVGVRRSKALGILAHPARALALLRKYETPSVVEERACERLETTAPETIPLPPATLYVHVSRESMETGEGVARMEGVGPITLGQASEFLRHSHVTIKPVIDLEADVPVDSYEVPTRLREQLHLRTPASAFPWSPSTSRRMDVDHTTPWSRRRTTRADPDREPRQAHPLRAPHQDPRPRLATPTTRARRARLANTPRLPVPRRRDRHPLPRQGLEARQGTPLERAFVAVLDR